MITIPEPGTVQSTSTFSDSVMFYGSFHGTCNLICQKSVLYKENKIVSKSEIVSRSQ